MSGGALVRFGLGIAFIVFWWFFLAPAVDIIATFPPVGPVISQDRLDTMNYLSMAFRIAPLMLLLAWGLNLWATALNRSTATIDAGRGLRLIASLYGSLIALMLMVISIGPTIDNMLAAMMDLPSLQNTVIPMDLTYLALSWFYPLIDLLIVAVYAGLFIAVVWKLSYTQTSSRSKGSKGKSDFF
ncbi:MAG TPA: hypothetical protein O0Y14_03990 [Methanocorpusculum sp.]|nr:hypothetical protein [Methanocorpusculum sp.]